MTFFAFLEVLEKGGFGNLTMHEPWRRPVCMNLHNGEVLCSGTPKALKACEASEASEAAFERQ